MTFGNLEPGPIFRFDFLFENSLSIEFSKFSPSLSKNTILVSLE